MTTAIQAARADRRTDLLSAAFAAFALGAAIFFATGFAAPDAIHNATHDTRHAFALPCH